MRRINRAALLVATVAMVTAACGNGAGGGSAGGDTLRVGTAADVASFIPYELPLGNYPMLNQIYNVLVRFDADLEPQPELAHAWTLENEGRSLRLELEEGVTFHNGAEFTAEDVKFSVEYVQNPPDEVFANIKPLADKITSVEVVDDHTVVLHSDEPNASFFDLLDLLFIIDSDSADSLRQEGIGTGPFQLEERIPGEKVVLTANESYWREPPSVQRVELVILPDPNTRFLQLETGAIDLADSIEIRRFLDIKENPDYNSGTGVVGAIGWSLFLNLNREPFTDPAVRSAMSLALDRQRMVEEQMGGVVEPRCLPHSEQSVAYTEDLADSCSFDLQEAERLLDEAGLSEGFEFTLITHNSHPPAWLQMAQIYQDDLAKIGVTMHIDESDIAGWSQSFRAQEFDMAQVSVGRAAKGPTSMFRTAAVYYPEDNLSGFESEEYGQLLQDAEQAIDESEQKDIYRQINELILRENWILSVAPMITPWASTNEVTNVEFNRDGMLILENVDMGG